LLKPSGGEGRWCVSRHSLKCKHISCLLIELGREIVFAGTHGDGIYAAEDQGRSWMRKDRGGEFPDIYSLNFVESGGELRLYAGTEPARSGARRVAAPAFHVWLGHCCGFYRG
jgi:hypothetical protein